MSALLDLLEAPDGMADGQRLATHLRVEFLALFGFLFDPTLDTTDWRTERALRPAGVNRKVSGENSTRGDATQEILCSLVQTARLRDLDSCDILVELLRSRHPIVSPALATTQEVTANQLRETFLRPDPRYRHADVLRLASARTQPCGISVMQCGVQAECRSIRIRPLNHLLDFLSEITLQSPTRL